MSEEAPRRWTLDHPDGPRIDVEGNAWYACDPYPTWYRWENHDGPTAPWSTEAGTTPRLITNGYGEIGYNQIKWADQEESSEQETHTFDIDELNLVPWQKDLLRRFMDDEPIPVVIEPVFCPKDKGLGFTATVAYIDEVS